MGAFCAATMTALCQSAGVSWIRGLNPWARIVGGFVHGDGDHREAVVLEFLVQCLPPGQVVAAAVGGVGRP
jgi:hypothetical protein